MIIVFVNVIYVEYADFFHIIRSITGFYSLQMMKFPKKNVRTAFYSLIYFRFFGVRACSTRSTVCNRDHIILNILLKCMLENILMREKGEQPLVFSENNNTQTHSMSHKECVSQRIL